MNVVRRVSLQPHLPIDMGRDFGICAMKTGFAGGPDQLPGAPSKRSGLVFGVECVGVSREGVPVHAGL